MSFRFLALRSCHRARIASTWKSLLSYPQAQIAAFLASLLIRHIVCGTPSLLSVFPLAPTKPSGFRMLTYQRRYGFHLSGPHCLTRFSLPSRLELARQIFPIQSFFCFFNEPKSYKIKMRTTCYLFSCVLFPCILISIYGEPSQKPFRHRIRLKESASNSNKWKRLLRLEARFELPIST